MLPILVCKEKTNISYVYVKDDCLCTLLVYTYCLVRKVISALGRRNMCTYLKSYMYVIYYKYVVPLMLTVPFVF